MFEILLQVVDSAAKCLRGDGVFSSFSPCMEQVQRTCGSLSKAGFFNIRTIECLLRSFDIKSGSALSNILSDLTSAKGESTAQCAPHSHSDATISWRRLPNF